LPQKHYQPLNEQRTTNNEQRTTNNEQRTLPQWIQLEFKKRIRLADLAALPAACPP
jgi:hypothetical protein